MEWNIFIFADQKNRFSGYKYIKKEIAYYANKGCKSFGEQNFYQGGLKSGSKSRSRDRLLVQSRIQFSWL